MSQGFVNQQLPSGLTQSPTKQIFTSGSGTYTTPANVSYIRVKVWGAGGGGGGNPNTVGAQIAGGGGSGGYCESMITTPAATYTYAVGAAGVGNSNANGSAGGTSTFSAGSMSATGGSGGLVSSAANSLGGAGGTASGGNYLNIPGSQGNAGVAAAEFFSGRGGNAPQGGVSSAYSTSNSTGVTGSTPGGGGSGAFVNNGGPNVGGTGGAGEIIVEEYYSLVSPAGSTGTGNYVLATSPTINQPNLVGVTTNSNAAAGSAGEFVSNQILQAAQFNITASTGTNVTSISLTAGDWDVSGNVYFFASSGTGTFTAGFAAINTVSATLTDNSLNSSQNGIGSGFFISMGCPVVTQRISLASTTTVYLVAVAAGYGAGTNVAVSGYIGARRVR